ncbi:MAG: Zinc carboxypeptidase, partial [Acidobacteria bacterium]|nr:Zinc carboxypeptidase [Acidobacteriota bacterium]
VKQFVLVPGRDRGRAWRLVELLRRHQIEVFRAAAPFTSPLAHAVLDDQISKRAFDAGVFVVPAAQPQKRLLRTLLDRETPMEEAFLAEVRKAQAYNDRAGESAPKQPRAGRAAGRPLRLPVPLGLGRVDAAGRPAVEGGRGAVARPAGVHARGPLLRAGHGRRPAAAEPLAHGYGAIWYLFEQVYRVPFTAVRVRDLLAADLRPYNVIVLPDGPAPEYARALGQDGADRLRAWAEEGGTLVCIKGAALWAAGDEAGLTTARDKFAPERAEGDSAGEQGEGSKEAQEKRPPKRMRPVPGVYVALDIDTEHYLGTGMPSSAVALVESSVAFVPTEKGARVAAVSSKRPIVAGFTFDDAEGHLAGAPFLWDEPTGRGHVTLFADDVTYRTFLHGAHRLLLNAVLLGPSFTTRPKD